MTEICCIL